VCVETVSIDLSLEMWDGRYHRDAQCEGEGCAQERDVQEWDVYRRGCVCGYGCAQERDSQRRGMCTSSYKRIV
jgi:hypothetical protein